MLSLKPMQKEDFLFIFNCKQNKEFQKYWINPIFSDFEKEKTLLSELLSQKDRFDYVLYFGNQRIGFFGAQIDWDKNAVLIGFGIAYEYWNQGYGTKGLSLFLFLLKTVLNEKLNCSLPLLAYVHLGNIGSQKVLLKNGFFLKEKKGNFLVFEKKII